jgi:copper homeostasis protein
MEYKLEICADSVESALNAQIAGADRIELCDNLPEGGTTPGLGKIKTVRRSISIGLNVIIRPRGGDFLYAMTEYEIMKREIELCGENGVDGIVLGILRKDGMIDIERTSKLIELAIPMSATFNRAFDLCADPERGLDDVIASGASRLLTSGMKDKVSDGTELVKRLISLAGNKIIIMPGGGINDNNINEIARMTGAKEYHLTARKQIESKMEFVRQGISMGGNALNQEFYIKVADPEMIRSVIRILKMI